MGKKKTHEEYVAELAIKNPNVEVVGLYINATTPICHRCKTHNKTWDISPSSALRGTGCSQCGKEKIGAHHRKTHEEYVAEVSVINPKIMVVGQYKDSKTPIAHYCTEHDIIWNAYPINILRGHGCCMCGNNVKKTQEQYVKEVMVINPNIEVIEEYIDARTKILHRCKIDGYEWYTAPYVILRGDGCPKCGGNARKSTKEYTDEVLIANPNIEVLGNYINALTPILHKCKIDDHEWFAEPANILSGRGCPKCKSVMLSKTFVKSHEQYVADVVVVNPDIEVIEKYINAHTPIMHCCKKDGFTWKIAPSNVLSGQGCPQCQESHGERQIRQWLKERDITCIYQKTFSDCRNKKELPFDFYLPDYNMCIEYDGQQHFEPVDFAGKGKEWAKEQFLVIQLHDQIKNQYCQEHNVQLLRIPYYTNIQEELEKFFIHLI